MMRAFLGGCLLILMSVAPAMAVDAALITVLQGEVTVASEKGLKRPAQAFLKLASGDRLQLKPAARLQIVFFDGGRQETWRGAGVVELADREGRSATLTPEVKQLSPLLVKQIARTPGAGQHGRAGMVVMRSLTPPGKVEQLEKQYGEFRQEASADDLTPEVFYLSGLIELKEYGRAKTVLSMLRSRTENPAAGDLVAHFSPLAEPPAAVARPAAKAVP